MVDLIIPPELMEPPFEEQGQSEEERFDASDPKSVNNARKKAARERAEDLAIVKEIMAVPQGRKWFYRVLESCHIFRTTFIQGDSHASAFQEGQRDRGLRILSDIMECSAEQYVIMCKENNVSKI